MKEQKIFGFKNVHVAKITENNGSISYGTPIFIPGGVSFSMDAEGEESTFYADNRPYYKSFANNGYSGSLEMADIPEEFLTNILGQTKDTNGALIENSSDKVSKFALMCEADGDPSERRFVFYNCLASRPSVELSTNEEGREVKTATMNITMAPRSTDGQIKAVIDKTEENQTVYNNFFDAVYEENATASV